MIKLIAFLLFVYLFWTMKELNEKEGGIKPLTSPQETEMSSSNGRLLE